MQTCRSWAIQALGSNSALAIGCLHRWCSTAASGPSGILAEYLRQLNSGKLHADNTQLAAVQALQLLQDSMAIRLKQQLTAAASGNDQPASPVHTTAPRQQISSTDGCSVEAAHNSSNVANKAGAAAATAGPAAAADPTPAPSSSSSSVPMVQGAYLWGPVGSGKTLIMDMFLSTLPSVTIPTSSSISSTPGTSSSSASERDTSSSSSDNNNSSSSSSTVQTSQPGDSNREVQQLRSHRIHYHEFMLAVHERLHHLQQSLPKIVTYSRSGLPVYRYALPPEDPVHVIARDAAAGLDILCLDELHITDVADAMLLARLFEGILNCGCMVLFTSNRPATDLYKGGLSRKYFEPFIKLIDERLLQLKVAGGRDYRLLQQSVQQQQQQQQGSDDATAAQGAGDGSLWFVGVDSDQRLQQQWQQLVRRTAQQQVGGTCTSADSDSAAAVDSDADGCSTRISLPFGRTLWIPKALLQSAAADSSSSSSDVNSSSNQVPGEPPALVAAFFTFIQLCSNQGSRQTLEHAGALSSNDYLTLVRSCPVIFIQGLPQLTPRLRDEARRLVTLVDLVYEVHTVRPGSVRLMVSSEVTPEDLFLPLLGAAAAQGVNPNLGKSSRKLDVKQLVQDHRARNASASSSAGDVLGAAAGEVGAGPWQQQQQQSQQYKVSAAGSGSETGTTPAPSVSPLLPEEVLMYHRASSRLVELCRVVS